MSSLPTRSKTLTIDRRSRFWALACTSLLPVALAVGLANPYLLRPLPKIEPAPVTLCLAAAPAQTAPSSPQAAPIPAPRTEPQTRESTVMETPPAAPPKPVSPTPVTPPKPQAPVTPPPKPARPAPAAPRAKPAPKIPTAPVPVQKTLPATASPALGQASSPGPVALSPPSRTAASPRSTSGDDRFDPLLATLARLIDRYKKYPRAAQRARLEGVVRLKVTIDRDGAVTAYSLLESSGHQAFDQATLKTMARVAGRKIADQPLEQALEIVVPVRYELP